MKKPAAAKAQNVTASASSASSATQSALDQARANKPLLIKLSVWSLLWYLTIKAEFGAVFFIASALWLIFSNLSHTEPGQKASGPSAYSVFNKGGEKMMGSLDASQFENELRHQPAAAARDAGPAAATPREVSAPSQPQLYKRTSKQANQPCVCGSGKKYKVR
jgi:hypothetical protein